jgi:putative FmdB family regulatory protein
MPLYEYRCVKCGRAFEIIQKLTDPPVKTCPHCGGPVKKVISPPALQFKGSGFYITDYAKKGASPSEPKAKEKTSKETSPSSPPSDKKTQKDTTSSPK